MDSCEHHDKAVQWEARIASVLQGVSESMAYNAYQHSGGVVAIERRAIASAALLSPPGHCVVVAPHFAGICSADVREIRGLRHGRADFGHEVIGRIVFSLLERLPIGTSVALNPFAHVERSTGFAELMPVFAPPDALYDALVPIPRSDAEYVLLEPLACVVHAFRRLLAEASGLRHVLVSGAGFFGYLLYCYLTFLGISVTLTNRSRKRLEDLARIRGDLRWADADSIAGRRLPYFDAIFLMQTTIGEEHVEAAANVATSGGSIVLFGGTDARHEPVLASIRSAQRSLERDVRGRKIRLVGTIDADNSDLVEALRALQSVEFSAGVTPILRAPVSFQDGLGYFNRIDTSAPLTRKAIVAIDEA